MKKQEIKHFKGENAGRSMTEMLGVLAIIGVLSLGGIIGYKLAMNRYAANQIAYEINMMKTDAKVKIMQGNDTLTLGEPYDSHKIRFGDYGTTFGCSFIKDADDESVVEEAATCQVANAYYIELKNIPEGICKPLANLIENMNDLIAFDINPKENGEVEEGGDCEEGDNTLNAVFSAEPGDLDVLKCDSEKDCSGGLKCHNHLCVECIDAGDCEQGNAGICTENNTCDYCNEGEVRDENDNCVECTENSHCNDTKPYCDINNDNICKSCYEAFGEEKPKWDTGKKQCVACPTGTQWDTQKNRCKGGECESNADCNPDGGHEKYCYLLYGYSCNSEFDSSKFGIGGTSDGAFYDDGGVTYKGECHMVSDDLPESKRIELKTSTGETRTYYGSTVQITWWSACRLCAAHAKKSDSFCVPGTKPPFMAGWGDPDFKCADTINVANGDAGYCYKTSNSKNVSETITALKEMYDGNPYYLWLRDSYDSCKAYGVRLGKGQVDGDDFIYDNYALCRDPD